MDTHKIVEQFEEFFKANVAQLVRCGAVDQAQFIETQRDLWLMVWQVSRESVVVELPARKSVDNEYGVLYDSDSGWILDADDVVSAIEAQGLKVAP